GNVSACCARAGAVANIAPREETGTPSRAAIPAPVAFKIMRRFKPTSSIHKLPIDQATLCLQCLPITNCSLESPHARIKQPPSRPLLKQLSATFAQSENLLSNTSCRNKKGRSKASSFYCESRFIASPCCTCAASTICRQL